ncbi:MAG TPA: hypothetical protein VJQ56_06265, partial [Blastocatellia bacterium]|nr:hypothetical protein [Blastocatellia bacterium]
LQTILIVPLAANDWMWRTAVAGSLVSMLAFVVAALALYHHARRLYNVESDAYRKGLPLITAAVFILNPSALYMQTTPMSELVFMGAVACAAFLLQRWVDEPSLERLIQSAAGMTVATLARYEAWPVAAVSGLIVLTAGSGDLTSRLKSATVYSLIVSVGPVYWLWHNWAIYGNPVEFLTGPNSARGIYLQNEAALGWAKIFVGNFWLDLLLLLITVAVCAGPLVLMAALAGLGKITITRRRGLLRYSPAYLLVVPFIFHLFSLYRGEIQIFPFSAFGILNIRYGLPHLLPVALFAPASALLLKRAGARLSLALVCAVVAAQYFLLISEGPRQLAIYQEGFRNGVNARSVRERERVSDWLRQNRPRPMILMQTGALGPLVSNGGLEFSGIIHEGTIGWHAIEDRIPEAIRTVIIHEGDPLDRRIAQSERLAADLASSFREEFSAGKIKVFTRR